MHGHCQMGAFSPALSLLEEMKKNGIEPNVVTFTIQLYYLYRKWLVFVGIESMANNVEQKVLVPVSGFTM